MRGGRGTIGILPPGALGVGFFHHLTRGLEVMDGAVFFVGLAGSASVGALRGGWLRIQRSGKMGEEEVREFPGEEWIEESLAECARADRVPEVLLVCPNPDQLLAVVDALVDFLEREAALALANAGGSWTVAGLRFPTVIFSSNGIYFQRIRQIFVEKLEESILFGRLPELWPDLMPAIVGRLLRGVTIQTGLREGTGRETIYRPGARGQSRLAGGDAGRRERAAALLEERGGWFKVAGESSPTRLEFDKAIINLVSNFFGLIHAFGEDGTFSALKVGEILVPENAGEIEELIEQVFTVGKALRVYGPEETLAQVREESLSLCRRNAEHVPSSLQYVDLRLRQGGLTEEFTPTEEWLITPLLKYARSTGVKAAEVYFVGLRERLEAKLRLGVAKMRASQS